MTAEQLLGRLDALQWLLTTVVADAISRAPVPHAAATGFRAVLDQQAVASIEQGRALGDTSEGWRAAAFAEGLMDLRDAVLRQTAAGMADQSGPRN